MIVVMLKGGLVGERWRQKGAVVDVPESVGKRLIEQKAANVHDGPESEPAPEHEPEPAPKLEKAVLKPPTEKR